MAKEKSKAAPRPVETGTPPKPLKVTTHRGLVARRRHIIAAVAARPELLPMLALNPVIVFREVGVHLSPEIADHVLRSLQHPPAVRAEREGLVATFREKYGELPQPTDGAWVARWLFTVLGVAPLDTEGATPVYVDPIPADALERLQALRPARRRGKESGPETSGAGRPRGMPLLRLPDSVLRLDLEAPARSLPPAADPPAEVTLEALWFYRGAHPSVPAMLRLGVIERGGVPIFSPDAYRKARSGERPSPLLRWITEVRFQTDKGPR